ncbi:MAG: TolC family protein [Rikenellaceae bacterium]
MKNLLLLSLCLVGADQVSAQIVPKRMTLDRAISIAHESSSSAQIVELSFMLQYWSYRSYKAELLPSVNLDGYVGGYDRSNVEVRNSETGEINYVANNTLTNYLTLSLDQEIALTGGTVSVSTSLTRLDQFDYNNILYNSVPFSITYTQPLRSFNTLKWQKKTAPLTYENAKRSFLESMESITINTATYFFAVLSAQTTHNNNVDNNRDTRRLYEIAKRRFEELGTITKSELLQLELAMLNSEISMSDSQIALESARFTLAMYMGVGEDRNFELVPPTSVPDVVLDYDFVLDRALANSSHETSQQLEELSADMDVAQAKADRGIQIQLGANLGMSNTAYSLPGVYRSPADQEIVGISISMPIFDWGMSKGQIKMAEAERAVILTQNEQEEIEFRQDIRMKVLEFNNRVRQCSASLSAQRVARERYEITLERFENGSVTVTDLNTAQDELNSANDEYVSQLTSYWSAYYEIRQLSLYDYIQNIDINAEFDKIIENQL